MDWNLLLGVAVFAGVFGLMAYAMKGRKSAGCAHSSTAKVVCPLCTEAKGPEPEKKGDSVYYCPMHPEVTSTDPEATCPKCGGMKLQPKPKNQVADA